MSGAASPVAASGARRRIETLVTYLEMRAPPARPPRPAPRSDLEIRRARRPTVSFYRYLYAAVGEPWTWTVRRCFSDAELQAILCDPRVEVNVLWVGGVPAGYAELDRRAPPDIELAYFGLMPEFIGQGLGGYLLDWAIHHAWRIAAAPALAPYLRPRSPGRARRLPALRFSHLPSTHEHAGTAARCGFAPELVRIRTGRDGRALHHAPDDQSRGPAGD